MKLRTNRINGTNDSGHTFLVLFRNMFRLILVSTSMMVMFYDVSGPVRLVMVVDRRWNLGEGCEVPGKKLKAAISCRSVKVKVMVILYDIELGVKSSIH